MSLHRLPRVLQLSLEQVGALYRWGGKGSHLFEPRASGGLVPHGNVLVFDCSGLAAWADWAAGGPDRRASWNTDRFWNELPAAETPFPGCYALYGGSSPADVSHLMTVVAVLPTGHVMVVGASGGDSHTTTAQAALAANARVKVYPTHEYRKDFRGFRAPLCSLT